MGGMVVRRRRKFGRGSVEEDVVNVEMDRIMLTRNVHYDKLKVGRVFQPVDT